VKFFHRANARFLFGYHYIYRKPLTPYNTLSMLHPSIFSQNTRIFRTIKGLSQKGLASMSKLSQAQISKVETNGYKKGTIPSAVQNKILAAFEMSEEEFSVITSQPNRPSNAGLALNPGSLENEDRKMENSRIDIDIDSLESILQTINVFHQVLVKYKQEINELKSIKK
jgi:transcriptional regulator with XRE-family HTH domain